MLKRHCLVPSWILGVLGCAAATSMISCATTRVQPQALSQAEIAVRKADAAGAAEHAPLELHVARQKLEQADRAIESKKPDVARRLAEQAFVDAELAEAMCRAERARRNAEEVGRTVEALRGESYRPTAN
jgi:hypothetical protein